MDVALCFVDFGMKLLIMCVYCGCGYKEYEYGIVVNV
jgi:hypothetical protein